MPEHDTPNELQSGFVTPDTKGKDLGPTSETGYASFLAHEHPETEQIGDDTYMLSLPLPVGGGPITSTLCYVMAGPHGEAHLVDPGWNSDEDWNRLTSALKEWGLGPVKSVFVTHLHIDHIGMAERIRQEYGATMIMGEAEWALFQSIPDQAAMNARYDSWGVPFDKRPVMPSDLWHESQVPVAPPDQLVREGDKLDMGRPMEVMVSPGHTEGSLTLRDDDRRLIMPGDNVLPHIHPGLGLDYDPDGDPLGDYLDAIESMNAYDGYEVLPGHGFRFAHLALRNDQTVAHHLRRTKQVVKALETMPADVSVWELASKLHWSHGWDNLEGYFLNSALQQTSMHLRFVRNPERSAKWLA